MHDLPPLAAILKQYGITPRKELGQNFLFDLNLTAKIVRAAGPLEGRTVIEIGPGPGGLTRSILQAGAEKVIAIDQDERCMGALNQLSVASGNRLQVIHADALKIDEREIARQPVKIIANLPYNIGTVLLFKWLDYAPFFESMTLMFQKEVAQRITAKPRSKAYGRLSVMAQWQCETEPCFDVPPQAFIPPPKVVSSVITLKPRQVPLAPANKTVLENLTRAVFSQRRKTLRSSLKQLTDSPIRILEEAGIDETRRPEELSIEEFCLLARLLEKV